MGNLSLGWVAVAALLACGVATAAGDVRMGAEKAQVCAACHGADGNSQSPDFPRLAGQHPDYLYQALSQYKSGKRKDPVMAAQVEKLTKADMQDLAAYFARQSGLRQLK